ncbi:hypothetical protein D0T08_11700 [Emticicia sp. C21]|nr:hypothetical protein D0T08_11700 [Emticicia sp. C21]
MSLFSFLASCFADKDRHPDMPFLPGSSNAHIKVDSFSIEGVDRFIFSADKTKLYAIVAEASTGGTYNYFLVEFDEEGKKLRDLFIGDIGRTPTTLSMLDANTLIWDYSNVFYIINLPNFKVIDVIKTYYQYDYPQVKEDEKLIKEQVEKQFEAKRVKIAEKYNIQKIDSVSLEIVEGDKKNADAYWTEFRAAKNESDSLENKLRLKYYQQYANKEIKTGTWFLGYKDPDGEAEYLFTKIARGKVVAFLLDSSIDKSKYAFAHLNINEHRKKSDLFTIFYNYPNKNITDKKSSIQITERITTEYNEYKLKGPNKYLFYYDLMIGKEKTSFKRDLPIMVSNDYFLESASGNAYIVANSLIYKFSLVK